MALQMRTRFKILGELRKGAKARGLSVNAHMATTPTEELLAMIRGIDPAFDPAEVIPDVPESPLVDPTRWGLPPFRALRTDLVSTVPEITQAVVAARAGDWRPAASLLERSWRYWPLRSAAVQALAETAVDHHAGFQAWRAAAAGDRHLALLEAHVLNWAAWRLRGDDLPEATSPAQQEGFLRTLPQAEAAARRAAELLPEDPTPWVVLLAFSPARDWDRQVFLDAWGNLQARDPLNRAGHEFALQYWESHDPSAMFAFAERAVAASPSLGFLAVQAALATEDADPSVWRLPLVHNALNATLHWLGTPEGAAGPYAAHDRRWAALGLVESGRPAEALPLFTALGVDASGEPWKLTGDGALFHFDRYRRRACAATRS